MKNLTRLFYESMCEVKRAGLQPGEIRNISINTRAKNRWGQTKMVQNHWYVIDVSDRLLNDNVSDTATKDTIIHEILHTCEGCFNHGEPWQRAANRINSCYPQYNIKRCTSPEEKGIQLPKESYKYTVSCPSCGSTIGYNRAGKVVQHPNRYRCAKCNGALEVKVN